MKPNCCAALSACFVLFFLPAAEMHGQEPEDKLKFDFAHFLKGKWEPTGEVQNVLGITNASRFFEFRPDADAQKRMSVLEPFVKKLNLSVVAYGWMKETNISFVAGQETGRYVHDYPFAVCTTAKGLVVLAYDTGTEAKPHLRDRTLNCVRGAARERDLLFLSGVTTGATAFRRAPEPAGEGKAP